MTQSINRTRARAKQPEHDGETSRAPMLICGVRICTGVLGLGTVTVLTIAFLHGNWRLALAGSTLLILTAIGGAVLIFNALQADRIEYYRRGMLDGWMRGWRGQEPEVDDPLSPPH